VSRRMSIISVAVALSLVSGALPANAASLSNTISAPARLALLPNATWGVPSAINNSGVLVGTEGNAGGCSWRAVRWSGGTVTELATISTEWSRAYSVDSTGNAVGFTSSHLVDDNNCVTPVPRAVLWNAWGQGLYLAPDYPGTTVATSIDDAGHVIGYAIPAGADADDAIPVQFINQQVVPLVTNGPLPFDGTRLRYDVRPGPNLTNNPGGDYAFGWARNDAGLATAFVAAVDPGTFIPQGTYRWLIGAAGLAVEPNVDGTVAIASGWTSGTLWRRLFRSGHPGYQSYGFRLLCTDGMEYASPVGISPDGTLAIGQGDMSSQGFVYAVSGSKPVQVTGGGLATGISNSGLVFGHDAGRRPVTWQYTR
jgi:hypothetical protein